MLNQSQPSKPLQHTMASLSLVSMAAPPLYASLYEPFYIPSTAVVSPSVSTFSAGRNGRHFHRQTPKKTPTLSRVNCQFVQVGHGTACQNNSSSRASSLSFCGLSHVDALSISLCRALQNMAVKAPIGSLSAAICPVTFANVLAEHLSVDKIASMAESMLSRLCVGIANLLLPMSTSIPKCVSLVTPVSELLLRLIRKCACWQSAKIMFRSSLTCAGWAKNSQSSRYTSTLIPSARQLRANTVTILKNQRGVGFRPNGMTSNW